MTNMKEKEDSLINSTFMKEILKMDSLMEKAKLNTKTVNYLSEHLNKILDFMVDTLSLTEAITKAILKPICQMEKVNFIGSMELNIQDSGNKVFNKVKEYKFYPMENS